MEMLDASTPSQLAGESREDHSHRTRSARASWARPIASAYRTVGGVFRLPVATRARTARRRDARGSRRGGRDLGFARSTGDWRALVADPAVDVVEHHHAERAARAHGAGRDRRRQARPLREAARSDRARGPRDGRAAEKAGVKTQVGFNYLKNPLMALAREIVASGEIGEIVSLSRHPRRGLHGGRRRRRGTCGWTRRAAVAWSPISAATSSRSRATARPDQRGVGRLETVIKQRPEAPGSSRHAAGRGRRHRARAGAFRARLRRHARGELAVARAQDADRVRGGRLEGRARLLPGALERAAALQGRAPTKPQRLPHHRRRPRASALRRVLRRRPAISSASTTSRPSRCATSCSPSRASRPKVPISARDGRCRRWSTRSSSLPARGSGYAWHSAA